MDTAQWPQEIVVKPIEDIVRTSCEKKTRPHADQALNCPRCHSTNTKFCYFNNYSLTQPRYFCKTCRRYWTEGGSLRNIPVGGGSRKNKRSSTPLPSSKKLSLADHSSSSNGNPTRTTTAILQHQDLIRATADATATSSLPAMELLAGLPPRVPNTFMPLLVPDPTPVFGSGFALHDFKPSLTFSLDVIGSDYDAMGVQGSPRGRNFFPFELETNADVNDVEIHKENTGDGSGFWSGIVDRHLL